MATAPLPAAASLAPTAAAPERLPPGTLAAYSLPSLGVGALMGLVLIYFLKYATDVLLLPPALVGGVFGAARIWDAASDPLAGHWSDRTGHRLGRRRPWLLASALLLPVGFVALWAPPGALGDGAGAWLWFAFWVFFLHTALTVFAVPYRALGAELSRVSHQRTRLFAGAAFAAHVGGVAAIACVAGIERADDPRAVAVPMAVCLALATAVLIAAGAWSTREASGHRVRGGASLRQAFGDVWRDRFVRRIVAARFAQEIALGSTLGLLPFASQYLLDTPGWTAFYLASAVTGLMLAIPVWVALSRRLGKRRCWMLAAVLNGVVFAGLFVVSAGDGGWVLGGSFLLGAAGACASVVAPSLLADGIDGDAARTGQRKEGAYFAAWTFAEKSAIGVKFLLLGLLLQLSGFEPGAEQTPGALLGLRLAIAGVPCLGMAVVLALLRGLEERE